MCLLLWEVEKKGGEEREREREKEREREIEADMYVREKHQSVASHMLPDQGLNLQTRYMPSPGIEPTIFFGAWDHVPTN